MRYTFRYINFVSGREIMYLLADCNNFYASCERVFRPELNGKPVIVLSNNDGCVIARSNEAKALGVRMGQPFFELTELRRQHGIAVFSTNFVMYGDMSNRVKYMLSKYSPQSEDYSIDESFLLLEGFERFDLHEYGQKIAREVRHGTGIPISVGIAPTKTLAKVANKFAKKYPRYKSACVIDSDDKRVKALKLTDIGDVWGVGRRYEKKLRNMGVNTAYDFTQLTREWVRKHMTVVGEKMWRELRGESCIDIETIPPDKKQIMTSRSFGSMIGDYASLAEAVSNFACICAGKLRKQKSCTTSLMVFLHTNPFREDMPQYYRNIVVNLPVATNSSMEIVHYALEGLRKIYREGYQYKKAGVMLLEIVDMNAVQINLFDTVDRAKHSRIMEVMDFVNGKYDRNKLKLAVQGNGNEWKMRQEQLSPCYTTRLSDILKIK